MASGSISGVIFNTSTSNSSDANSTVPVDDSPYILAGDWDLGVADGNVTGFDSEFIMVHTDGTGRHTHELNNFEAANGTIVQLDENGTGTITGSVDVSFDGEEKWSDVTTVITIERHNAISIALESEATEDHFQAQPIYGVVESWLDVNGMQLITGAKSAVADAGETLSGAGQNLTDSAGRLGNQTGEAVQNATNATGGFFEGLGDRVEDLFNGTDG
jgi:hypothetical protein